MYLVLESCASGLCERFAKPSDVFMYVPEVRILPTPLNVKHLVYKLGAFLLYCYQKIIQYK